MDTYVYKLGELNYINLTNECTNDCIFCVRRHHDGVGGYDLRLKKEPTAQDVIRLLEQDQTDVVFCGLGEPTVKLEELKEIARFVKSYGGHVRINTNGHASLFHGRDVAPELAGLVDKVSISLNEADAAAYAKVTNSRYGRAGFDAMLSFARSCIENGIQVTLSVVDVIGEEDIEAARQIAEDVGAAFRVRSYVD